MTVAARTPANPYVLIAYLTAMFSVSFASGSPLHYLYMAVALLFFLLFNAISMLRSSQSIGCFLYRRYRLPLVLLLVFSGASLISMLLVLGSDAGNGQKLAQSAKYLLYLIMMAYCFCLAWFCARNGLSHQRIYLWYSAGLWVLILSLLALYVFFDAPNYRNWGIDPPVGGHVRIMGMYASVALCVLMVQLLFAAMPPVQRALCYFSVFVFMVFLVWSGSRVSIVLVFFMCLLISAASAWRGAIPWKTIAGLLLLMLLAMPLGDSLVNHDWGGLGRFARPVAVSVQQQQAATEFADTVSSGRVKMWFNAVEAVKSSPWFGLGAFGYFFYPEKPMLSDHVHNVVLQFLVEWGVIGGGALMLLLAWVLIRMLLAVKPHVQAGDTGWLMTAAVLILLNLNGLTDGTYSVIFPLFMMATAYAHLLVSPLEKRNLPTAPTSLSQRE